MLGCPGVTLFCSYALEIPRDITLADACSPLTFLAISSKGYDARGADGFIASGAAMRKMSAPGKPRPAGLSSLLASSVQTFEAREIFAEEKRAPGKAPCMHSVLAAVRIK